MIFLVFCLLFFNCYLCGADTQARMISFYPGVIPDGADLSECYQVRAFRVCDMPSWEEKEVIEGFSSKTKFYFPYVSSMKCYIKYVLEEDQNNLFGNLSPEKKNSMRKKINTTYKKVRGSVVNDLIQSPDSVYRLLKLLEIHAKGYFGHEGAYDRLDYKIQFVLAPIEKDELEAKQKSSGATQSAGESINE